MLLPTKLHSGQNFKTATVSKVNEIIDYLKTQRITGDNKTLKVNQLTSGIGLSVIQDGKKNGSGSSFDHPFKMTIVKEDEESEPVLNIAQGRVQVCWDTEDRTYVMYYDEESVPLDEITTDGEYTVDLMIQYDPDGESEGQYGNAFFKCNIIFLNNSSTTAEVPSTRGIFETILGEIKRETDDEGNVGWMVTKQQMIGDFNIDMKAIAHPFSMTVQTVGDTLGEVKNGYAITDFALHVQEGDVLIGKDKITANEIDYSFTQAPTWVYCVVNEDEKTATLSATTTEVSNLYDNSKKNWFYEIGKITIEQSSNIKVAQKIWSTISSGADTYKVKAIQDDAQPDFLSSKFVFDTANQKHPLSGYQKSYIGSDLPSSNVTEQGLSGTQYKMKPIWMYMNITDYDEDKEQYLMNKKGTLKWSPGGIDVSGSLGKWEQVKEVSGKNLLRWKPEYTPSSFSDRFYFMSSVKSDDKLSTKSVLSGVSFGVDTSSSEIDGFLTWNKSTGLPSVEMPPPSSELISAYVLTGVKGKKLEWKEMPSGSLVQVSGSLVDNFEVIPSGGKQYLRWQPEYESVRVTANYFLAEDGDSGEFTKWTWVREDEEKEGLFIWSYSPSGEPLVVVPPEATDDVSAWIYAGSKNEGFSWYPYVSGDIQLSGSIENLFELVQDDDGKNTLRVVTEYDESVDQFHFVNLEEDGKLNAITFEGDVESNGQEGILIWSYQDKEPEITQCEDEKDDDHKILAGDKTNGLYWVPLIETITGQVMELSGEFYKVAVNENDPSAEFLEYKVSSVTGSILLDVDTSDNIHTMNFEINPDFFFSSDGTIGIEATDEGLDFTISSYLVQVEENDDPGYLKDKITSETGSLSASVVETGEDLNLSLDINPDYFFSSDGSLSIEQTEEGLDFNLSSYFVQVDDTDLPEFLAEKITSASGSLIPSIGENGEGKTVNLEINPEYFFSSDGSLSIEQTEEGLDFNLSSYFVQVTDEDLPEYLSDKISSASGSLVVDIGQNGEGQTVNLEISPDYFFSSDGTIGIEATDEGLDFTLSSAVVSVTEGDLPEYLSDKITSASGSLVVGIGENGEGQTVNLEIDPEYFSSSDESIDIEEGESGLDFRGGKVKVDEDDTAGYLADKITVDDSIASLITLENTGSEMNIKSALSGSGLLKVENGTISPLTVPNSGNYILACSGGVLSWVEYKDCENACSDE